MLNIKNIIIYLSGKYGQFIKFTIVGCSNVLVSLITYYICIYFGAYYQFANIAGFITGTFNSYLLNKNWVFGIKKNTIEQFLKFYCTYFSSWLIGAIMLFFLVEVLKLPEIIVPIINIFITTPLNYIMSRFWTFAKR
ncbi:MAG: GtrA family protein [Clostridium butyricum]|nr:GtrA family protein [Clostridium butyricum]